LKASVFVGSGISSRDHAGRLPHEARVVKSIMRQSVSFESREYSKLSISEEPRTESPRSWG
jgi:hypothetical protein